MLSNVLSNEDIGCTIGVTALLIVDEVGWHNDTTTESRSHQQRRLELKLPALEPKQDFRAEIAG